MSVVVFEDIHWADEATMDFLKFLARRRITQLRCLFILTYRDNEIHSRHPLRSVMGQLNPDSVYPYGIATIIPGGPLKKWRREEDTTAKTFTTFPVATHFM